MRASPAGRGRLPAATPVLFVIDGDPRVAHALRDDLSRRFGVQVSRMTSTDRPLSVCRRSAI